jgi:putative ABC transport system ATP-binding protein
MRDAESDSPDVVTLTGVTREYRRASGTPVAALRGIDLRVRRGEFVAITGPSGSGKSTLLHVIAGLDEVTAGTVRIDGVDLAALSDDDRTLLRRRRIGFVLQFANLLPTLSVAENVGLPLVMDGARPAAIRDRVDALLEHVGLTGRRDHRPDELSGGETQRATLARALLTRPALLLADEPTGALDSENGAIVLDLLRHSVDDDGQTVVMVTHEPRAASYADRVVHIEDGRLA